MDQHTQHDQQEWLPVADYESEAEAQAAAAVLTEAGIGSMIDRRPMMGGRYALLVATLEQGAAARALDIAPEIGEPADEPLE